MDQTGSSAEELAQNSYFDQPLDRDARQRNPVQAGEEYFQFSLFLLDQHQDCQSVIVPKNQEMFYLQGKLLRLMQ